MATVWSYNLSPITFLVIFVFNHLFVLGCSTEFKVYREKPIQL